MGLTGALWGLPVLVLFAAVLWKSAFGRSPEATQAAAVLYLLAGPFFACGFMCGAAEEMYEIVGGGKIGNVIIVTVPLVGCAWCVGCGVISMRWRADLKIYADGARPDPLPDARPVRGDNPEGEE